MARSVGSAKFSAVAGTVKETADRLGVSSSIVAKWRAGDSRPGDAKRQAIAREWPEVSADSWLEPLEARVVPAAPAGPGLGSLAEAADATLALAARTLKMASDALDEAEHEPELAARTRVMRDLTSTLQALGKLTGEARELSDAQLVKMPAYRRMVEQIASCLCGDCLRKVAGLTDD